MPGADASEAERSFPEPFDALLRAVEREQDPYRRNWRLIDAIEWSIKWETAVVLGSLLDRGILPTALREHLAGSLHRPSLGTWLATLRIALESASDRPFAAWDLALEAEEQHQFAASRNAYAHGAVERDDQARAREVPLRAALVDLTRSRFLTEVGLLHRTAEGFTHHGGPSPDEGLLREAERSRPDWGSFAWIPASGDLVWLWPLAAHLGETADGTLGLYFHNALRTQRVESLSYELPEQRRDTDLFLSFSERAPLSEWNAESENPNRGLIEELLADTVGRQALISDLKHAATEAGPVTVVLGAPGQGKSSVMAGVAYELRRQPHAPLVVDAFLRRQDHASEPLPVLSSFVRRIALALGRRPPTMRTIDEASAALISTLGEWDKASERPVLLLIDGLDEQPEMLRHLPVTTRKARIIWSARPTDAVVGWLMERRVPRGSRFEVGPLDDDEVRSILYRGVDKLDPRLTEAYVRAVLRLSDGNPLFVSGLSDLLFEEPERIGDHSLIPEGVEQLFQSTLDRAAAQHDPGSVYETLALLAVVHDRLDEPQIAELRGCRIFDARAARRALDELVSSSSPGDPRARHGLFHDRLRQWVAETMPAEVADMNLRLARSATDPRHHRSSLAYLVEYGILHIRAVDAEEERRALIAELTTRLADPDFGEVWRSSLDDHRYVELLAQVDELGPGREGDDALVELLVRGLRSVGDPSPIDADAAQDVLAYRPERTFADRFYAALESSLDDVATDRPNLRLLIVDWRRRRASDDDRRAARTHLAPLVSRTGDTWAVALDDGTRAKALYQAGYILHLEDQPEQAIESLLTSADLAASGGNRLHEWVARCVAARFASLRGTLGDDQYVALLDEASAAFAQEQSNSSLALRWVANTVSKRLELATRRGRIEQAHELLLALEADPWIRTFQRLERLDMQADRIRIAAGEAREVRASVEQRLEAQLERGPRREGVAELHRDVARVRLASGDRAGARAAARAGLDLPPGSAAWIARPDLERIAAEG